MSRARPKPVARGLLALLALAGCVALLGALAAVLRVPALAAEPAAGPATGSWTPTDPPSLARFEHTATKLANGSVLVVGGADASQTPLAAVELYDATGERFKPAASLAFRRKRHSATLIAGGKLLVAGGIGGAGTLAKAEVYDPADNSWSTSAGSLSTARSAHSASALPDGKLLLAGGTGADGKPLSSAELYDPATGSFSATGSLASARTGHSATPLPNGRLLLAGGSGADGAPLSSAEIYDPATGSFSATGSLAGARTGHSATAIAGGKLLLVGGKGTDGKPLSSAELYDPVTGSFSAAPGALASARSAHSATLLADGLVLLAGGLGADGKALSSTELYDPAGGGVSEGSFANTQGTFYAPSSDPYPRAGHSATLLSDGKVLVTGGTSSASAELYDPELARFARSAARQGQGQGGDAVMLWGPACRDGSPAPYCGKLLGAGTGKLTELYDPVTNSWSGCAADETGCGPAKPANLAVGRSGATLTLLDGPACRGEGAALPGAPPPSYCGKVLLVGGTSGGITPGQPNARVELYDPATGRWSSCETAPTASAECPAPFPGGGLADHSATLLADGRVLVAGGSGGVSIAGARRDFYIYNPMLGRWSEPGALYNGRAGHRAVLLEGGSEACGDNCGKVLLVGGQGAEGVSKTGELIDPRAGAGETSVGTPELIVGRSFGHSLTLLKSGYVLVAGGGGSADKTEYFAPKAGATGGWAAGTSPRAARGAGHTATLLPSGRVLFAGGGFTSAGELFEPGGGRSLFVGQGPAAPQSSTLLPSGPASVCKTSCGKVALTSGSSSSAPAYGWLYSARPELSALGPTGGPVAGGTRVTLQGRGLASATSVRFGALEATSLSPDPDSPDTKLVVSAPPHPPGTVPVTVTSSGGRSASASFTYTGSGGGSEIPTPTTPGAGSPQAGGPQAGGPPFGPLLAAERSRSRALRGCLAGAGRHTRRERKRARRGSARARAKATRHLKRHSARLKARCLKRHGRTPGPVTGLSARGISSSETELGFLAPGSDRQKPPPARAYLVKQSSRPIRTAREFRRAQTLCGGACRFPVSRVGEQVKLKVTGLRPKTTYYYAIAARDNVSRRLGPRSAGVRAKTP